MIEVDRSINEVDSLMNGVVGQITDINVIMINLRTYRRQTFYIKSCLKIIDNMTLGNNIKRDHYE